MKVQIEFSEEVITTIAKLKEASGVESVDEVLRDAIGLYEWAREQIFAYGNQIGAFNENNSVQILNLFRGLGGETRSLRLWPRHLDAVERWAKKMKCTRSEAIRQMIQFATQGEDK